MSLILRSAKIRDGIHLVLQRSDVITVHGIPQESHAGYAKRTLGQVHHYATIIGALENVFKVLHMFLLAPR